MKKLLKFGTLVVAGVVLLTGCGTEETPTPIPAGKKVAEVQGENIGSYHFDIDEGISSKVVKDKDGCVFMVTQIKEDIGTTYGTYGLDIEFMGGCYFPELYENK